MKNSILYMTDQLDDITDWRKGNGKWCMLNLISTFATHGGFISWKQTCLPPRISGCFLFLKGYQGSFRYKTSCQRVESGLTFSWAVFQLYDFITGLTSSFPALLRSVEFPGEPSCHKAGNRDRKFGSKNLPLQE